MLYVSFKNFVIFEPLLFSSVEVSANDKAIVIYSACVITPSDLKTIAVDCSEKQEIDALHGFYNK